MPQIRAFFNPPNLYFIEYLRWGYLIFRAIGAFVRIKSRHEGGFFGGQNQPPRAEIQMESEQWTSKRKCVWGGCCRDDSLRAKLSSKYRRSILSVPWLLGFLSAPARRRLWVDFEVLMYFKCIDLANWLPCSISSPVLILFFPSSALCTLRFSENEKKNLFVMLIGWIYPWDALSLL